MDQTHLVQVDLLDLYQAIVLHVDGMDMQDIQVQTLVVQEYQENQF